MSRLRAVVDAKHKGRGYEVSKGHYVQVDEDELKAVEIESTHTVDGFVPKAPINKRYLDKPHYIAPQGKVGADAFAIIRDAMKDKDRVALAKIVIAHREHIIAVEPLARDCSALRCTTITKCVTRRIISSKSPRVSKDTVTLAAHILETKETKFDPRKFKDEKAFPRATSSKSRPQPSGPTM